MNDIELAPTACIVCGRKHPGGENVPGWAYLAGAQPIGSMACSPKCTEKAVERFHRTGRCDTKIVQ